MELVASDRLFDYFEANFTVDISRICYYFWLSDGNEGCILLLREFTPLTGLRQKQVLPVLYIRREDIVSVPEWAKKLLFTRCSRQLRQRKRYISGKGWYKDCSSEPCARAGWEAPFGV